MSDFDQVIISEEWENTDVSLLETLDHVLNRGLVIAGEITIAVADIDLIFVGLNVLVSSVETAHEVLRKRETGMKLYAYCLCADLDSCGQLRIGVSGASVRVLKIEDISVLVSDCETVRGMTQEKYACFTAAQSFAVFSPRTTPVPISVWNTCHASNNSAAL
jgi:hypothetical protein